MSLEETEKRRKAEEREMRTEKNEAFLRSGSTVTLPGFALEIVVVVVSSHVYAQHLVPILKLERRFGIHVS